MAGENPRKPQLGDHLMQVVWPIITSNGMSHLQMASVRSHSTLGKEKEARRVKYNKPIVYGIVDCGQKGFATSSCLGS
jgi:hypothetical protein